jgi:aspartokinase
MSTRIFTSYLRQRGVPARQFDAPEIGFITSDDFGNAEIIYEQTLGKVRRRSVLHFAVYEKDGCQIILQTLTPHSGFTT